MRGVGKGDTPDSDLRWSAEQQIRHAEAAFADYSLVAKGMAVGIELHQGDLGLWNAALNLLFCAGVALLCISGK